MEEEDKGRVPESVTDAVETVEDAAVELGRWFKRDVEKPMEGMVGGRERLKVIAMLACVLALDAADKATIGALAASLESALHIGNVQVGLLVTVSTAIGAVATLPFGILVDRTNRTRLLVIAIGIWSLAMVASAGSVDYLMLLLSRVGLGIVVAVAAPAIASLVGDFFHPGERGRIYGYILAGELIGVAFGFLISGDVAAVMSWRVPFLIMAGLGAILAVVIAFKLHEPQRGGQGRMESVDEAGNPQAGEEDEEHPVEDIVKDAGVKPHRGLVPHDDPAQWPLLQTARYVLSIPTFRVLIVASALGYFYFTGLRTFAVVYMREHFHLAQATASSMLVLVGLGAIVGVLLGGWAADRWIAHGELRGRVITGAIAYLVAALGLLWGLLMPSLLYAAPLFFVGALGLGGANPVVDAARLDIMHSRLWGRAEGIRAALLYAFEAAAPLLFGWVSSKFGDQGSSFGRVAAGPLGSGVGLEMTFLIMLVTLAGAGIVMFRTWQTYPRDVATAIAFEQRTQPK